MTKSVLINCLKVVYINLANNLFNYTRAKLSAINHKKRYADLTAYLLKR